MDDWAWDQPAELRIRLDMALPHNATLAAEIAELRECLRVAETAPPSPSCRWFPRSALVFPRSALVPHRSTCGHVCQASLRWRCCPHRGCRAASSPKTVHGSWPVSSD